MVLEGEKTCDAGKELFLAYVVVTSMNGAMAPHLTDWSPLEGRNVVGLPDNDINGQRYVRTVAALVLKEGALEFRIVQLPEGLPTKWDLADPVPDGVDVKPGFPILGVFRLNGQAKRDDGVISGPARPVNLRCIR